MRAHAVQSALTLTTHKTLTFFLSEGEGGGGLASGGGRRVLEEARAADFQSKRRKPQTDVIVVK